jgi:predicted site-specific integrase-resolvase
MAEITQLSLENAEIFLTVAEVARKLDIAENTLTTWLKAGDFPNAFRVNPRLKKGRWIIPKSDLDAFIEKRRKARGFCYTVN